MEALSFAAEDCGSWQHGDRRDRGSWESLKRCREAGRSIRIVDAAYRAYDKQRIPS